MAALPLRLGDVDEILLQQNGPLTKLYKVAAPNTTIVNRALVTDFSKDLLPKFAGNRVTVQQIQEVQGESGVNGEKVFKVLNDVHDQVRCVGSDWSNTIDVSGAHPGFGGIAGSYIEIIFYGTGVNLLTSFYATNWSSTSLTYSVDGGSTSFVATGSTYSAVIRGRNYPEYSILPIVSGLTNGLHSVKIAVSSVVANGIAFSGFETIGPTTLNLSPGTSYIGGRKLTKPALTTDTYNSNFESGTLGSKGGHVVVYQKSDGSMGKAVQPADVTQLNLTATNHVNETVIRNYSWREFGAGRSDDFSLLTGAAARAAAFTLDDGTTSLVLSNGYLITSNSVDCFTPNGTNDYFTFTFVGTGLDIVTSTPNARPVTVTVDGSTVLTGTQLSSSTAVVTVTICSGLPYGTHTVKVLNTTTGTIIVSRFIVYGPSKPAIPTGAVEIADYYVMANYTAASSAVLGTMATGVLRKVLAVREATFTGTWSIVGTLDAVDFETSVNTQAGATGSTVSYTFFGTGFEWSSFVYTNATSATFSVDGSTNLSGFTTSLVQTSSGLSFAASTGILSGTSAASGRIKLQVSNLSLGLHTVKLTTNNANQTYADCLDVITPIHSPKSNLPGDLQNTLTVGSQAIGDSRKFALQAVKAQSNWAQAVGVSSSPTTTSTAFVPLPDMELPPIRTSGNPLEIYYNSLFSQSTTNAVVQCQIYVDGVAVGNLKSVHGPLANYQFLVSDSLIVPVAPGNHIVQIFWNVNTGTGTATNALRNVKAREL